MGLRRQRQLQTCPRGGINRFLRDRRWWSAGSHVHIDVIRRHNLHRTKDVDEKESGIRRRRRKPRARSSVGYFPRTGERARKGGILTSTKMNGTRFPLGLLNLVKAADHQIITSIGCTQRLDIVVKKSWLWGISPTIAGRSEPSCVTSKAFRDRVEEQGTARDYGVYTDDPLQPLRLINITDITLGPFGPSSV